MSLLSRLGRVLKANLGRLPGVDADKFDAGMPWDETTRDKTTHNQTTTNRETQADARIAGYYAALELPFGADLAAVKQAHRRLVKRYHPDRFHSEPDKAQTASEVTRRLNEAYQGLCRHLEANA